jgi:hypothetical protein
MDRLVSVFYWPTVLWVEHPALTMVPVIVFGAAYWRLRRTGHQSGRLLVVTLVWLAYAVYEGAMSVWAQNVIAPIRIDLILLGPVMYAVTALGVVHWWRALTS